MAEEVIERIEEGETSVVAPPVSRPKRVSKWDRAPDPHDWRYFVGGLGKVLIATGLLMFGFVAYQLWGTGIETARAQNELENQFDLLVADAPVNTSPDVTASTVPATVPATDNTQPTETIEGAPLTSSPVTSSPATSPPASSTTVAAVDRPMPPIARGDVLAKLEIPRMGKTGGSALYVVPGVDLTDLKKGPGHYPQTPLPGQLGNAAIAGHRTTFGEPFRQIDELVPGDEIIVTMVTGERFVYAVTSTEIVGPDGSYVIATTDPTVAMLTLTSCDPEFTARNRIAVHALLVPDASAPVGKPTFYDLDDDKPITGTSELSAGASDDNPTVTADSADESAIAVGETDDATGSTDAGAGIDTSATAPPAPTDAFAEGWFHDPAAWSQIALWGAALVLITIVIRKISRRTRHDSIGILAGAIPFLICLYFFYQNVNRLLPPGF